MCCTFCTHAHKEAGTGTSTGHGIDSLIFNQNAAISLFVWSVPGFFIKNMWLTAANLICMCVCVSDLFTAMPPVSYILITSRHPPHYITRREVMDIP